ncbi:MAG: DUF4395 domain-containing protein [Bacteroidota bacterium]|nr:DUF4395 domain-containing protein [Bacteroidota bacterium]
MSKVINFGEDVEGYEIPVLNEREIRAAAGILFVWAFLAILAAIMQGSFVLLKYFILAFLFDFIIRVFISPKFSPTLVIGRLIVRRQVPEYVGAAQKKFAWVIGLFLALTMLVLVVFVNSFSPITGIICLICLIFLLFESAFGICLGCLFYGLYYGKKAKYCPGEVCEIKDRHEIQKTSWTQVLIVLGFIAFIVLSVYLFKDTFSEKPQDLFKIMESAQSK